jgi:hypothetical protein
MYEVTLRRFRKCIVAMEKRKVLTILIFLWPYLSSMHSAWVILYCHLLTVRLYRIFPNYFIKNTIFEKKLLNLKHVFWFSLQFLSETFCIRRTIQQDIIINWHMYSCKISDILVTLEWHLTFINRFWENHQISYLMEICLVRS